MSFADTLFLILKIAGICVAVVALVGWVAFLAQCLKAFLGGIRRGIEERRASKKDAPPSAVNPESHPCAVLHDWVPIAAHAMDLNGLAHTFVVKHCSRCREHHTFAYPGNWTIETFLKTESDAAREIRALEGMAK